MVLLGKFSRVFVLVAVLSGCAWVEQANEETIRIGIGDLGLIAPGLRQVVSYPDARTHCAKFGKEATLVDLKEKTAIWRCVPPK
ncbi:MAG: hypothetical protein ACI9MJ_001276 [Alphaproteobacteria bacterium]|jgi:hypothetical protein